MSYRSCFGGCFFSSFRPWNGGFTVNRVIYLLYSIYSIFVADFFLSHHYFWSLKGRHWRCFYIHSYLQLFSAHLRILSVSSLFFSYAAFMETLSIFSNSSIPFSQSLVSPSCFLSLELMLIIPLLCEYIFLRPSHFTLLLLVFLCLEHFCALPLETFLGVLRETHSADYLG